MPTALTCCTLSGLGGWLVRLYSWWYEPAFSDRNDTSTFLVSPGFRLISCRGIKNRFMPSSGLRSSFRQPTSFLTLFMLRDRHVEPTLTIVIESWPIIPVAVEIDRVDLESYYLGPIISPSISFFFIGVSWYGVFPSLLNSSLIRSMWDGSTVDKSVLSVALLWLLWRSDLYERWFWSWSLVKLGNCSDSSPYLLNVGFIGFGTWCGDWWIS